jgi:hypothetical protein
MDVFSFSLLCSVILSELRRQPNEPKDPITIKIATSLHGSSLLVIRQPLA